VAESERCGGVTLNPTTRKEGKRADMADDLGPLSVLLCDENTQTKYVGQEFDDFIQIKSGTSDVMWLAEIGTMLGQMIRRICDEQNNKRVHVTVDAVPEYKNVLDTLRADLKAEGIELTHS
jgi:hypothetical protein